MILFARSIRANLIVVGLLGFFCHCSSPDIGNNESEEVVIAWHDSVANKPKQVFVLDKKSENRDKGIYRKYRKDGSLSGIVSVDGGKKHGVMKLFDRQGNLKSEMTYSQDILDGEYKSYYADGKIFIKGAYKLNQQHGKWTTYSKDGDVKKEEYYENGELVNMETADNQIN